MVDSKVLRNRHLRVAAKRWQTFDKMKTRFLIYFFILIITLSCDRKLDKTNAIYFWEIENYQIAYFSKIGPVGPSYFEYEVYKNDYFISKGFIKSKDSCKLEMKNEIGHYILFDLCTLTKEDLYPKKIELDINKIDSVIVFTKKTFQKQSLTKSQINIFVKDWNKSDVLDLRDYKPFDSIFYPDYKYKVWVYSENKVLELIAFNHLIADKSKWIWEISNKEGKEYFYKILNEN